jgi:phenylacetate-CoA ligase
MDTYGRLYQHLLYPLWERVVRQRPTLDRLRHLEKTQWRSLDELLAVQAGDLRRLLRHANANVPFYHRRFEAAGLRPEQINGPEELCKLPIVTRDDARAGVDERAATAGATVDIRKSTSGTLGSPLTFGYDLESEYWRQAIKLRGYAWAGYRPGLRSLHYWGAGAPNTSRLKRAKANADHAIRREHYIDCGRRGPEDLQRVVEAIVSTKPQIILCYSQAGADLARFVVAGQHRRWDTIPVICGAERLLPADRAVMNEAFGPEVFETYGSREVMLMATECAAHDGLHVSMENLIVEVVVREGEGPTGRSPRPGELGEVVVTDLHNFGMPFIRYATGDLAIAAPPGACSCGRVHPRLSTVEGRVTETLLDAAGNRVNGLVFNVVIAHLAHAIRRFQVVQHRDRSITLRIVPTATFDAEIETILRQTWQRYLAGVAVTIERVEDIPLSKSGKRQVVSVER